MRRSGQWTVGSGQPKQEAGRHVRAAFSLAGVVGILLRCFLLSTVHCPLSTPASAADRPIRESLTLPVEGQTAKSLFAVDELLAEERYAELTALLVELSETHGGELVADRAQNQPNVNRYLNVTNYCQRVFAGLPPAGRAAARGRLDPAALRWFNTWQTTRDPKQLERILHSAFISSFGDNALWELGNIAWEQGDTSQAAAYWRRLVGDGSLFSPQEPRYPDPEFSAAEIDARLILCEIMSRQDATAKRLIADYREKYPAATGQLAGQSGALADILTQVLEDSRHWPKPARNAELATFGGSNARQRTWPADWDVGPPRWSAQWPIRQAPTFGVVPAGERGPLQKFPVVDDQLIYVNDGDAIRAWNSVTGEPAWPNDQTDPAIIYPSIPEERVSLPDRPCVGVPRQTLTLHRGKLLARMGSAVSGAARNELRDLLTEIVCLDVARGQGKLLWKLASHDLPSNGPAWSFEGTPLVLDDTAYAVVYRRQPEPEFGVVALEVDTGNVRWLKAIGSARPSLDDSFNRISQLLLTQGDGRLYLSTDQGAIVAISPENGALLWAVAYESQAFEFQHGAPAHLQGGLLPPVFHRGLIFAAPNDSRLMFCLDAASGRVVWQKRMPERLRHLIGITGVAERSRLIASGNSLWAFDLTDGALMWRVMQTQPSEYGYGHGLLAGESVFWPTREWLYQVRQADGEVERKILLATPDAPHSGGNLAAANGLLFIAEPSGVVAYGEYSRLKQRLEIELSQRGSEPVPWQRMMTLEAGEKNFTAAIEAGRRAWQLRQSLSPPEKVSLERHFANISRDRIQELISKKELAEADQHYDELAQLEMPAEARCRDAWSRSRLDLARERPQAAVAHLHASLAADQTERFELNGAPAGQAIRSELIQLHDRFGPAAFEEVHRRAQQELKAAIAAGNAAQASRVLLRHPLLASADDVWSNLIAELVSRKQWPAVWSTFAAWESAAASDDDREFIRSKKQTALIEAGYNRAAARLALPSEQYDGECASRYVGRSWQLPFPASQRMLLPTGRSPAKHLDCVLSVTENQITAIDRQQGTPRWRQPSSATPVWLAYAPTHLLLATRTTLSARSLETGETLWQRGDFRFADTSQDAGTNLKLIGEQILCFDPQRGVTAISSITGEVLWEFQPPRGKLQPVWQLDDDTMLLQTLEPAVAWRVNVWDGLRRQETPAALQPWRYPPLLLDSERLACVTTDRLIELRNGDGRKLWKFAGAISQAHADPFLLGHDDSLAVLIDGGTLVGIDPLNGRKSWSVGFADFPITDPARQLAQVDDIVASAFDQTLRAVRLSDGVIAWEAALPSGIAHWQICHRGDAFAVMGQTSGTAGESRLMMFEAATGRPRQSLRQPCGASHIEWHFDDQGVVAAMPRGISTWNTLVGNRGATPPRSDGT